MKGKLHNNNLPKKILRKTPSELNYRENSLDELTQNLNHVSPIVPKENSLPKINDSLMC